MTENVAAKMFQRAARAIRSEWHVSFTSSSSLRSTLVQERVNYNTCFGQQPQNLTEDQIVATFSRLRMTRVWFEIDDAIITVTPGLKHKFTSVNFYIIGKSPSLFTRFPSTIFRL